MSGEQNPMTGRVMTPEEIKQAVDIGVLQNAVTTGNAETNRRLERIEKKLEEQSTVSVATFDEFKKDIEKNYVRKNDFNPVKAIVYGMVGLVLTTVFVGILALVVK